MHYLGTIGPLSVIYLFYILARLSERLGSVQKMTPAYRYYYVAICFMGVGFISQLIIIQVSLMPQNFSQWLSSPLFLLLTYHLPMAVGVTLGLIITWKYWSWLITDQDA